MIIGDAIDFRHLHTGAQAHDGKTGCIKRERVFLAGEWRHQNPVYAASLKQIDQSFRAHLRVGGGKFLKAKAAFDGSGGGGGVEITMGGGIAPAVRGCICGQKSQRSSYHRSGRDRATATHESGDEWIRSVAQFLCDRADAVTGGGGYAGVLLESE